MVRRIEGIDHWQQRLLASKRVEGDDQCLGRGLQLPRPIEEGPPQRTLARPVARYEQQTDYPRLVQRLKELSRKKLSSSEIAERLNAEGFRPPQADRSLHQRDGAAA